MRSSGGVRSTDVWARTFPRALRLAYLLVGDAASAERVAERTFIRLHVRYRDVIGTEGLDVWTTRTVVRLSGSRARWGRLRHPVPEQSLPLGALDRLRYRRRAAWVLSVYDGMEPGSLAHALDCSPGGAIALVAAAERAMARSGIEPPDQSDLARTVAELSHPTLATKTLRKASRTRALSSLATAVLLVASGIIGLETLLGTEDDAADLLDLQVPGLRDASDQRTDLARFGAPGWCPRLSGTRAIESRPQATVGDTAIRFDIALGHRGYHQTIDALSHPSWNAPPEETWPHHRSSGALGVIQISGGSSDPDLIRSCGEKTAARSLKVAVLQRDEVGSGEVIAFYMVLLGDTWKVWGSSGL